MSQAAQNPEYTQGEMLHDQSTLFSGETYAVKVNRVDDVRKVQAYVRENPDTTVFLDYQMDAAISRGANEKSDYFEDSLEYSRLLGGMTEHIDHGSYGVVTSAGCYQDFKTELKEEADKALDEELSKQKKDIFLNGDNIDNQPKAIGTAARIEDPTYDKMYGAIWRENSPGQSLRAVIEEDVIDISPAEYEERTHPVDNLWTHITEEAEEKTAESLLEGSNADPGKHDLEDATEPLSCPVHVGADTTNKNTPGYSVGEIVKRKQQTS